MRETAMVQKIRALGVLGASRLALDLLFTWFTMPSARLLRRPFYVRNHGKIVLGKGFTTGPGFILDVLSPHARLVIGNNVKFNHRTHIGVMNLVELGDNCLLASNVYISDHGHGNYRGANQDSPSVPPNNRPLAVAPVKIGRDVWLGENVCVLPGVNIGDGSIVGANSVVTTSLPANCIAAGAPARVVKEWNSAQQCWVKPLKNGMP